MSNLIADDKKYLLNVYKRLDLEIVRGEGSYLYDIRGERYLDMFSGIAVNNLGLSDPGILNRITEQAAKVIHLSNYFASEPVVNLARLLVENSFASKVFFTNSGTEANEAALKLARKFGRAISEDKFEILTAHNSFHGRTMGGLTLTGQEKYQRDFHPLLPGVKHFTFNDIEDFKAQVSDSTCAVFLEIIQGEGGIREVTQEFIDALVSLSTKHHFLIVVDEIQTGLGRTADLFAYEKFGFTPDIVTLAKSLGGGIPIGAMLVSEKIEDVLKPGDHGSTFGGNPLACAVGEYVVGTILDEDFREESRAKSSYLLQGLTQIRSEFPSIIQEIRGRGFMLGIEVGNLAETIKTLGLKKNLLLNVTSGTVVRLLPPLTITYDDMDTFLRLFREILREIQRGTLLSI